MSEVSPDIFLKARQVRDRYGHCSHMWIVRRMQSDGFPTPTYFGRLRFWKVAELDQWDRDRKAAPHEPHAPGFSASVQP